MRLSNPKAQRYTLPVWVRGALSHQPSTTRSALNLSGFRASLGSGHAPRGHDFHEKGTRRRHAPKRSAWCMVPGVGVEPPRVARPEPRSSGGPAPLIARAIVLARRSSKPCALAAPHDRGSTSPEPPPRVGSRSSTCIQDDEGRPKDRPALIILVPGVGVEPTRALQPNGF